MRKLVLLLLLLFTVSLAASADLQILRGKFVGIEQGDYVHLNIKNEKGEVQSFFITNDPSFQQLLDNPEKFTGRKVEVRWHTVERDIPEAGGKITIDEATSIQFQKK
jgi:hypothetical protein